MSIASPTLRHLLTSSSPNPHLEFTPTNTLLHSANGRIQHTDLHRGRTRTLTFEATRNVTSISLSSCSRRLMVVDERSHVYLLALPSSRIISEFTLRSPVRHAILSPCAKFAAFAGESLEIWQIPVVPVPQYAAFEQLHRFALNTLAVSVAWSPDSHRVAVGCRDGIVRVFTLAIRERGVRVIPLTLYGHRDPIVYVQFVGQRGLITLSADGVLFCWRLKHNDAAEDYTPRQRPNAEERSVGKRQFAVPLAAKLMSRHFVKKDGARRARCAAIKEGLLVVGMSNGVFALYQLPDEMVREDNAFDDKLFKMGEMRQQKRKKQSSTGNDSTDEGKSDDNESSEEDEVTLDDQIPIIPFTELTTLHTLSASGGEITRIDFNSTGEWIALSSAHSGQIVVWEWRSETHVLKQQAHVLAARTVAFSPDGRAVATGSNDGRVKLWGVATGFCAATFTDHTAAISAITFAAKDVIVSASYDGTVRAFDLRRYKNFRIMVGPPPRRQFGCVAVDQAGDLIAAGCVDTFEVFVWSLRTGKILEILNGHKAAISEISFRPGRGTLATSSWDRTVRLWDMYERKGNCEELEHSKEVLSICFRPDGKELASCTTSGEILFWNPETANITGTIDGARDAAAGRSRDSRTVAPGKGYFQSLSYSADGRFLLAGAASKHVCIYHVAEGSRPTLVNRVAVTKNQNFDGLLDQLNSKKLTESGHPTNMIDDEDENAEDYGAARIAEKRSLPGATSEGKLRRRQLLKAEVQCVRACATGRLWSAVTQEGVLVYGDSEEDGADNLFDPTNLEVDITPDAAKKAVNEKNYVTALLIALRLNERDCLNYVVERIPSSEVALIITSLPVLHFNRLISLFAWRLDHVPHLEFNLLWAKNLLLLHGSKAHQASSDPSSVNAVLQTLHRACDAHSKRLVQIADSNEHMLNYLLTTANLKKSANAIESTT